MVKTGTSAEPAVEQVAEAAEDGGRDGQLEGPGQAVAGAVVQLALGRDRSTG